MNSLNIAGKVYKKGLIIVSFKKNGKTTVVLSFSFPLALV